MCTVYQDQVALVYDKEGTMAIIENVRRTWPTWHLKRAWHVKGAMYRLPLSSIIEWLLRMFYLGLF